MKPSPKTNHLSSCSVMQHALNLTIPLAFVDASLLLHVLSLQHITQLLTLLDREYSQPSDSIAATIVTHCQAANLATYLKWPLCAPRSHLSRAWRRPSAPVCLVAGEPAYIHSSVLLQSVSRHESFRGCRRRRGGSLSHELPSILTHAGLSLSRPSTARRASTLT
jgi:hypothetical protein